MYIVKVIGDPIHPETTTYILQDENTHYIYEAQIELAANEAGSFDFTMRDDFPYWKKLLIMSSVIEVRTSEQEIIFRGRIRSVEAHGDYERAVYAEESWRIWTIRFRDQKAIQTSKCQGI